MTRMYSIHSFRTNPFGFDAVESEVWAEVFEALKLFEVRS